MSPLSPYEPVCRTSHSPWAMLVVCWTLALGMGVHLGEEMHGDAERDFALGDGAEWRVSATEVLAKAGVMSGLSALRGVLYTQKRAIYETSLTVGGRQLPPPLPSGLADIEIEEPEAEEPRIPAPKRVMIIGASSIQQELGRSLEQHFEAFDGVEVLRYGLHSTGLARPDYFDWYAKALEMKTSFQPDLVIGQFGGNDGQGLTDRETGRAVARLFTEEWDGVYAERLEAIVTLFAEDRVPVVVLGMPVMRDAYHQKKMHRINQVSEDASLRAGAYYIDTFAMTADDSGAYVTRAEVDGRMRIIRATDGTHLTRHGSELVAEKILGLITDWFSFTLVAEDEASPDSDVPPPLPESLTP